MLVSRSIATASLLFMLTVAGADAGDVSCSAARTMKSLNSATTAKMTFVNISGSIRTVNWIDFKGAWVQYAFLQVGQRFSVNTYMTHPWVVTDGPGNCIEIFMPVRGSRVVNLRRDTKRRGPE